MSEESAVLTVPKSSNRGVATTSHDQLAFITDAVQTFAGVQQLADVIAKMDCAPSHLKGKPQDCFRVVVQAVKWRMDPFAVAECTSLVHGRLCYEGKLVYSVLQSMHAIVGLLDFDVTGSGQDAKITVTGTPKGGTKPCVVSGTVKDWRTNPQKDGKKITNAWDTQPETQLIYRGTRQWARLYAPAAILGVYTPDEFNDEPLRDVDANVHGDPQPARTGIAADTDAPDAAKEKPADLPPKEDPEHIVKARAFYHAANKYRPGFGQHLTKTLCTLHKATAPKDLAPEKVEQFLKDLAVLEKDFATAEAAIAEWQRQEKANA